MHLIQIQQLEEIVRKKPQDLFAIFALAKEYEKIDKIKNAIELIENLLVIDLNYLGAYYFLGKLYEKNEQINKALNIYEAGILIAQKQKNLHTLSELRNAKLNLELEDI